MNISVVIPTCNRTSNLLALLKNLNDSTFHLYEVIIVDSGEERLPAQEYSDFKNLQIQHLYSEKSVCIQRNLGITKAISEWILLCDDDIEIIAVSLHINHSALRMILGEHESLVAREFGA